MWSMGRCPRSLEVDAPSTTFSGGLGAGGPLTGATRPFGMMDLEFLLGGKARVDRNDGAGERAGIG
jgi:hypothetical protein